MKFSVAVLILTLLLSCAYSQYNLPQDAEYCSSMRKALDHQNPLSFTTSSDPLLDKYDVTFYFLDIAAENDTVYLSGNVTIKAIVTATVLDTFAFELIDEMTIDSIFVNGFKSDFLHNNDLCVVPLVFSPARGQTLSSRIYYHGTPPTGEFFSGISTAYNEEWDKHVTWTLSEPYAAKEWFPVKQDLTDKADSVWVFVTTSAQNMAGSQGLLTAVTNMPGGKLRYEWKSHYPIDYYLISIAVSDYTDYSIYAHPANTPDSVLIQNFIYDSPGYLEHWKPNIDNTS